MNTARGSNQYKNRYHASEVKGWIFMILLFASIALVGIERYRAGNFVSAVVEATNEKAVVVNSVIMTPTPTATNTPTPTMTPTPIVPEFPQKDIENYIKVIFGSDSRVAIAVSHNECNPLNRQYPECVLHTPAEYSVGIFQINLYNQKHWIHAQKVPGATMEDKIEWLKNPYHNTLIAYKIFSDSGFQPWSAYTSGNYKNSL